MNISYDKKEFVKKYQKHEKDTGSAVVQIALLTKRIEEFAIHAKTHKKDKHSNLGLLKLISKRKKLSKYAKRTEETAYNLTIKGLGIRK